MYTVNIQPGRSVQHNNRLIVISLGRSLVQQTWLEAQLPGTSCGCNADTVATIILGRWVLGLNADVVTSSLVSSHYSWPG